MEYTSGTSGDCLNGPVPSFTRCQHMHNSVAHALLLIDFNLSILVMSF